MRIEDLPEGLEAFVDRARSVLNQEIDKAHKALDALNVEKATTQAALSELQDQREAAQKQLKTVLSNLDRGSTLAGLNSEIAEARKTLEALKVETEQTSTALTTLIKQRSDAQQQLDAVTNETQRLRAEQAEATSEIGHLRTLLKSVDLRRSA
jgi:chromosome segregation ATPase